MAGGIFGLLGGYLADLFGRSCGFSFGASRIYSVSASAAAFSTSLTELLILRSMTMIGVCVEFVAAMRVARRALSWR